MSSDKVIEINNLHHTYGRNKVLHGLSFDVEQGRTFGLLGKNGAGKTTTINIMMGFLRPESGTCRIFGEEAHDLSPAAKQRIALLHEGHLSYEFMNIAQTERFYQTFYPKWDGEIYEYLMKKLGLKPSHKIKNMSCGQRSQVALSVMMAQNADILILDDFSMGLDAGYRRLFLDHLNFYVKERNKTVLITSHIVQDLERFVDDALIIDKGVVLRKSELAGIKDGFYGYHIGSGVDVSVFLEEREVLDISRVKNGYEVICTLPPDSAAEWFSAKTGAAVSPSEYEISLEDAFISLTGKY
jgi:ABC-2 type transport system ATP-binding protein